jgi:NDP-sugar pyrophosphorylase family protein
MPTLLALAAGLGSRFGGPKQLAPLGPNGETILDFSIHDAVRAGFGRVVLVIRPELREAFERGLVTRWSPRLPVTLVEQTLDQAVEPGVSGAGRAKPWGTGHAVLAAADALREPFAVVNGDDYYGRDAMLRLGAFLAGVRADEPTYAVVGFPLGATLSEAGGVNRAVLRVGTDGRLEHVEEVIGIERTPDGNGVVRRPDGTVREIPRYTLVSMNMWGFTPAVLPQLAEGFGAFLRARGGEPKAEFLLPDYVQELIDAGRATVRVPTGEGPWFGMTHPEDREHVSRALTALVERGEYPSPVWA